MTAEVTAETPTSSAPTKHVDTAAWPELDPDGGIGPIRLGMTETELKALGLPISDGYAGKKVGPYRVLFEAGKVSFVEVALAELPGLRIGPKTVPSTERDIERIAKLLPSCGKMDIRLGGNVITCHQGKVTVAAAGPPGIVQLQVSSKPAP
jgi:hypothetical protein